MRPECLSRRTGRAIGLLAIVVAAATAGCGGNDDGAAGEAGDAGPNDATVFLPGAFDADIPIPPDDGFAPWPAPHASAPQVVTAGGPVLTTPDVVPIFLPNDPYQATVENFLRALSSSAYWPAAVKEYGVGALTISASIILDEPFPRAVTDDQIQSILIAHLASASSGWPAIDAHHIYVLFTPAATVVSDSAGQQCEAFGAYHYESNLDAEDAGNAPDRFVYAVIPRCANFGTLGGIDVITEVTSHEIVEAATDPYVLRAPAYISTNNDSIIWSSAPGGEIGDMCAYEAQSDQRLVDGFLVQRIWSNRQAAAGQDPCSPPLTDGGVYFNASPDLQAADYLETPTTGLVIRPGESATMQVRFFSSAPTSPWVVVPVDFASNTGRSPSPLLTFSPAEISGNNGDVVPITVTAAMTDDEADADAETGGAELYLYSYRPADPNTAQYWFAWVDEE